MCSHEILASALGVGRAMTKKTLRLRDLLCDQREFCMETKQWPTDAEIQEVQARVRVLEMEGKKSKAVIREMKSQMEVMIDKCKKAVFLVWGG